LRFIAFRVLQLSVFLGEWLLFYQLIALTPFPDISQLTSILSLLMITIVSFAVTMVVFRNR